MDKKLSDEMLELIFRNHPKEKITIKNGEFLFKEGEEDDSVYFLDAGELKIMKLKWVLWSAKSKEFVGISSFFNDNSTYSFSARATKDCNIYRIKNELFREILENDATFSRYIMDLLCDRIAFTTQRTKSLMEKSSKYRLIKEISNAVKENLSTIIPYSLEELSESVGVSKRLIRSIISEFEKKGLVVRTKNQLHIRDLKGLEFIGRNCA